ncbi:uncharacterized protein [Zea mays]|uniref:Uncharacterized protein n=1 Tax=Zea mays TaxID=4577 RepID=A0A804NZX5_MAIZE|nr:uncharacterized protein LOC103654441 isoform X1 [Zea mays]|eukprot:XP_008679494.1 uncharacterized protein LOC103654441 isoform X1 [Zea mays]
MPPELGMSSRTVAGAVVNRRPRRLFGRSSERKNPLNLQFERQVARLEARQQQQRCVIVTVIPFNFCYDFKSLSLTESASEDPSSRPTSPEENPETSSSPSILFLHLNAQDVSHRRWQDNSSRLLEDKPTTSNSMSDSDFLVNSFTKPSDNARPSRRKSKKKSKKHRQRCRKPTDGSEAKFREGNGAASAADVGDCEDSTLSPKHVGDIRFEETSPSSSVKEASEEAPESDDDEYHCCSGGSVSSASYCDEMELSKSTTSCPALCGQCPSSNLQYLDNTQNSAPTGPSQETCYAGSKANCNHDTKSLFIFRNERGSDPCEATEFCSSSSGFDENWIEKFDYDSGICSPKSVGTYGGDQAAHLCSDTTGDNDFCLVISRKRARKEKKMSLWKSYGAHASTPALDRNKKYVGHSSMQMTNEFNSNDWSHRQNHVSRIHPQHGNALKSSTKNFMQRPSIGCRETQYGFPAKESKLGASLNHSTGPREKTCGKLTGGFDKTAQQLYLDRDLSNALNSSESIRCETRSISSSEPTTPKSLKGNYTSESGESTDITIGALPMQKRRLQDLVRTDDASETISGRSSPCSESSTTELIAGHSTDSSIEGNHGCQGLCNSRTHLAQMLRVVNDACKVQVGADVLLAAGYPISDLEKFICSATPVIGRAPCMISNTCSLDQVVSDSVCQHDISNVSLRRIWEWYEEPGCYGLEVKALSNLSSKTSSSSSSEFFAYFVPYLSAIQLFGLSRNNMHHSFGVQGRELLISSNTASSMSSHPVHAKAHTLLEESNACLPESSLVVEDPGELIFEYFETEQPSLRPPLFEKIKELVSSANVSDHRVFGDTEKLQNAKLCELHPASWFCVAWYPVYRVPRGNFRAAFLTYHSLGKLVHKKCSMDTNDGHTQVVSPVVGLQSYNDKGEQWFQLRCPDLKQLPIEDSLKTSPAEVHKERLRTLKMGALAMARAVVPKGSGESVNHHPDYEFFLSRCA